MALQGVASVAGTLLAEVLGSGFPSKLLTGVLGAVVGAFLTAPGRHHGRRIVAVAVFFALLEALGNAASALAARLPRARARRETSGSATSTQTTPPGTASPRRLIAAMRAAGGPANWATVAATAAAGLAIGTSIAAASGVLNSHTTRVETKTKAPLARHNGSASTSQTTSSRGSSEVVVPSVERQRERQALSTLRAAGLSPSSIREPSEVVPRGYAARTVPAASQKVPLGTPVSLFVSTGPLTMPDPDAPTPDPNS